MVYASFLKESLNAKDRMIKTIQLRPCNVHVGLCQMLLDRSTDTLGKPLNVLNRVHFNDLRRDSSLMSTKPVGTDTGR